MYIVEFLFSFHISFSSFLTYEMNAIVGLCHFCEAHGPRPIFCTFTTDKEEHTTESSKSAVQCNGCTSLGPESVLVSKDTSGAIFCSRESVPNADVTAFLRQAAIRSITCEVSFNKEGGIVYFSDTHGHVLSLTFQLQDTRARGLKRWFSIVVLMKDKMLLMNISTMLSEHMQEISKELQQLAGCVFDNEQQICSQRALRLKTGRNDFGQSRSLTQLTGDDDVFKKLHSKFTWILQAGAHIYSETLYSSQDLLKKLNPNSIKRSIFEANACSVRNEEECTPVRALETLVSKQFFRILMYCTLTGTKIIIKTVHRDPGSIIKALTRLLPHPENVPHIKPFMKQQNVQNCCVLGEKENNNFYLNWSGALPAKCPTLMNRIESAISNEKFNDAVLHQHVKSLQLEWLGIARSVKAAINASGGKSAAVMKLKQILGVSQYDEHLLSFWMNTFC